MDSGMTPDVAKEFKRTRDLIQSAKRDESNYTDGCYDLANENDEGIMDVADLASENDGAITDLADYIEQLEETVADLIERVEALEGRE